MDRFEPKLDENFREYVALQLRRHNLVAKGREESREFETIEDQMTEIWDNLDTAQRSSVKGMSSDLNWVLRKAEPAPFGRKLSEIPQEDVENLASAIKSRDWHTVLHYLRLCRPLLSVSQIAHLRAEAYAAIGFHEYASTFYDMAAELDQDNGPLGVLAMQAIERIDPKRAIDRAEQVLADSNRFPPAVVALSASMILRRDDTEHRPINKEFFRHVLKSAVTRLELQSPLDFGRTMTYVLAAFAFGMIDDDSYALRCYEEGLKLSPADEPLLVGKGLLLYGKRTAEAVEAFERAVTVTPSRSVWPYFFLAHYHLGRREFERIMELALQAWSRTSLSQVKAQLLEWMAISQSELGLPEDVVRRMFDQAAALDPENAQIIENIATFDEIKIGHQQANWRIEKDLLKTKKTAAITELQHLVPA